MYQDPVGPFISLVRIELFTLTSSKELFNLLTNFRDTKPIEHQD